MVDDKIEALTVDNLKQVVETAVETALDSRLAHFATKAEVLALRSELENKLQTEKDQNFDLRQFVTEHTTRLELQYRRFETALDAVNDRITSNRELDDARALNTQQLSKQVESNTQTLITTQELTAANSGGLRRVEAELGDVLVRMIPLTHEVMGNRETGKPSLRAEWGGRFDTVIAKLDKIDSGVAAHNGRLAGVEASVGAIEKRHRSEDEWLRERPRKVSNFVVKVGSELFANSVLKWSIVVVGGSGLGAILIRILEALLGGQ